MILPFFYCGLKTAVNDRTLFFTDMFMAVLFPLTLQILIWRNIFSADGQMLNGMHEGEVISYYAFALIISRLNNGYDLIRTMGEHVLNGTLDTHLTKPNNYLYQRFQVFLGESSIYAVPLLLAVVARELYTSDLTAIKPEILLHTSIFLTAIVLAQLTCFALSLCIALLVFWTIDYYMLLSFDICCTALLGGTLLPLAFWPDWMQPLLRFNPYRFIISAPAEIFAINNIVVLQEMIIGASCYLALFFVISTFLWKHGKNRYHSAGG
ncbi:ABC-2 family transporter protein [Pseudomonas monteilii]